MTVPGARALDAHRNSRRAAQLALALRFTCTPASLPPVSLPQGAEVQVWYCDFAMNKGAQGAAVTLRDPGTSAEFSFSTFWQNSASGGWVAWVGMMGCVAKVGNIHPHKCLLPKWA